MCEIGDCKRASAFYVHVAVVPQVHQHPDGQEWRESSPAGRSNCVCPQHLARTVRALAALPIVTATAAVNVRLM